MHSAGLMRELVVASPVTDRVQATVMDASTSAAAATVETMTRTVAAAPASALAGVGRWVAREALFTVDTFVKLTASVFAAQLVAHLLGRWFPKGLWEATPMLMHGFDGSAAKTANNPPKKMAKPEYLFSFDGLRFYRHEDLYPAQEWPCPLRIVEPCRGCKWFLEGPDGRVWCAAIAKARTRFHSAYQEVDLDTMKEILKGQYVGRPAPTDPQFYATR